MFAYRLVGIGLMLVVCAGLAQAQPETKKRGFLGIVVEPAKDEGGAVRVRNVDADSPAAKAGVKAGDVVVKVDDQKIDDVKNFIGIVNRKNAGDKLTLHVLRDGKEQALTATLGARPPTGFPEFPEFGRFPPEFERFFDQSPRVRELERRIEALEKRLNALEKKGADK